MIGVLPIRIQTIRSTIGDLENSANYFLYTLLVLKSPLTIFLFICYIMQINMMVHKYIFCLAKRILA